MEKESFPHDYDARNSELMLSLRKKHGLTGIGIYWCVIEMLHQRGGVIPLSQCEEIADTLDTSTDSIVAVIKSRNLFGCDEINFWSKRAERNLISKKTKSEKASLSAKARWNKKAAVPKKEAQPVKKEKKEKKPKPPPTTEYGIMIEVYDKWFEQTTGFKPNLNGGEGKAMNEIISCLKRQPKIASGEKKVQDAWTYILNNLNRCDPFIAKQQKLLQIASNMTNILSQLTELKKNKGQVFFKQQNHGDYLINEKQN